MNTLARTGAAFCCWPWARLRSLVSPGIRILMYHRVDRLDGYDQLTVTPERFREQMRILAEHYRVIPLSLALEELALGCPTPHTVVLTFDDGYRDNLVHALPVLKEFGLSATVFVTTGFAAGRCRHPRYPNARDLHMDWRDLRQWLAHEGNEIGAHSCTHPRLRLLPDDRCRHEIADCLRDFAAADIAHNGVFCYPGGDAGAREAALVRDSGYRAAVSVAPGLNRMSTDRYMLQRTAITERDDATAFRLKVDGAFDGLHRWLHRRRERGFLADARAARARAWEG